MKGLDYLARIVATGTINGVGIGTGLDPLAIAFTTGYVDNTAGRRKATLWRDYGLVAFSFNRVGKSWVCCNFSVQLHRFAAAAELRAEWREAYGVQLPDRVTWSGLHASLATTYHLPEPAERVEAGARYFRYPDSQATVLLLDYAGSGQDVYSISVHPE
jgi:hypothetical protein